VEETARDEVHNEEEEHEKESSVFEFTRSGVRRRATAGKPPPEGIRIRLIGIRVAFVTLWMGSHIMTHKDRRVEPSTVSGPL